jgi:hypothetical protein
MRPPPQMPRAGARSEVHTTARRRRPRAGGGVGRRSRSCQISQADACSSPTTLCSATPGGRMLARSRLLSRLPSALAGSHPARRYLPAAVEAAHEPHEHRPADQLVIGGGQRRRQGRRHKRLDPSSLRSSTSGGQVPGSSWRMPRCSIAAQNPLPARRYRRGVHGPANGHVAVPHEASRSTRPFWPRPRTQSSRLTPRSGTGRRPRAIWCGCCQPCWPRQRPRLPRRSRASTDRP